jgi:ligand-binding sensor domain-containing protein/DNA-binding CsgD family transcriptional regulator
VNLKIISFKSTPIPAITFFMINFRPYFLELMRKILNFIIFLIPVFCHGQIKSIGTPGINNYQKTVYGAGTQNWGISQDKNGFMYFANNDGLLKFDGLRWELIKISQSSAIRSVCVGNENTVYVGLFNDFGILSNSISGKKTYKSLRNLLPDQITDFDDIWRIWDTPFGVVFQSFDYLFILNNNQIKVVKPNKKFHFSYFINNRLYLDEPGIGLFEFNGDSFEKADWAEKIKDFEIWAMLPFNENDLLIGTAQEGIYKFENGRLDKWQTPANDIVQKQKLYCATSIVGNHFAFGTILGGVIVCDSEGRIIQNINQKNGLQNNTVLSIFAGSDNNLWLGLDNGIDFVEITSPVTNISDISELGAGYCCKVFNGNIYLGTNQGLFVKPFDNFSKNTGEFELVKNTAGQVWSMEIFDDKLICGHNLGAFSIEGNAATKIGNEEGAWIFIPLKGQPDFLLGGYYNGLVLLKKNNSGWSFYKKIKGFNESSRFLHQDADGKIWMSHGSKGIYQITLNQKSDSVTSVSFFDTSNGLPASFGNIVFEIGDEIVISTIDGFYQFNPELKVFQKAEKFNQVFNINNRLKTLTSDEKGNYWFIAENESGVFRVNEDLTYTKITAPFIRLQKSFINEFEFIYPYNEEHIFIGTDNGFAHYTPKFPKSYSQVFSAFITRIEIPYLDTVLFIDQTHQSNTKYKFPFRKNEFRFHFAAPFFEESQNVEFSFFLENYSEKWSDWSPIGFKDFINLFENEYTLKLKARNIYGTETEITSFQFSIQPPWHRSGFAVLGYFIVFLVLILLLIKYIRYRIHKSSLESMYKHELELKKQEEEFQRQALIADKEIIRLRNEKLQDEMIFRDKELANQTMNLIQKNKFLIKLVEELQRIQSSTDNQTVKSKMISLKKRIQKEIDDKQQNRVFETYFDEVHDEFFNRMKEKYPDLSPKELRLCAYIRMNISTKEIASLLNISYRGVEINRYRLRKKLDLARDTNLPVFLSNI